MDVRLVPQMTWNAVAAGQAELLSKFYLEEYTVVCNQIGKLQGIVSEAIRRRAGRKSSSWASWLC